MPVRLGPRAESVLFTHLDGAAESEIGRPTRHLVDHAFVRRL
jgi:hypothetical protein